MIIDKASRIFSVVNMILLAGILTCLVIVATKPAPHLLTLGEYDKLPLRGRGVNLPVVAVPEQVGVTVENTGPIDISGEVKADIDNGLPIKVVPYGDDAVFNVKVDSFSNRAFRDLDHPIKVESTP